MGFVEDQHLKAVLGKLVEIEPRGIVCRDDSADILRVCIEKFTAGGDNPRNMEFFLQFLLPLRTKQLRADNQYLDSGERAISSLITKPALIVLPRPTSSARSVTGRRRQKVIKLLTW